MGNEYLKPPHVLQHLDPQSPPGSLFKEAAGLAIWNIENPSPPVLKGLGQRAVPTEKERFIRYSSKYIKAVLSRDSGNSNHDNETKSVRIFRASRRAGDQ
jgi:hypothetical protein